MTEAPQSVRRRLLTRVLPLALVVGGAAFIWNGAAGLFPVRRQVIWRLPLEGRVREVEVQLWSEGALIKRDWLSLGAGQRPEVVQEVALRPGEYEAKAFLKREGELAPTALRRTVVVGDAETVVLTLD